LRHAGIAKLIAHADIACVSSLGITILRALGLAFSRDTAVAEGTEAAIITILTRRSVQPHPLIHRAITDFTVIGRVERIVRVAKVTNQTIPFRDAVRAFVGACTEFHTTVLGTLFPIGARHRITHTGAIRAGIRDRAALNIVAILGGGYGFKDTSRIGITAIIGAFIAIIASHIGVAATIISFTSRGRAGVEVLAHPIFGTILPNISAAAGLQDTPLPIHIRKAHTFKALTAGRSVLFAR